ncbi:MAG: FISUMP domain-containing protein [Bacteroidota bacterium]
MKSKILSVCLFFITVMPCIAQTITDIDGNIYHKVTIGNQVWTKENLKVSHYNNGDSIPNVTVAAQWGAPIGAYCIYDNDTVNVDVYGFLYNWRAVSDSRGLCPDGWHVPTDAEWTVLTGFAGGDSIAGGKLKAIGTEYWIDPNTNATDDYGFSAGPGGYRSYNGSFELKKGYGLFWASTDTNADFAWKREFAYNNGIAQRWFYFKPTGLSVRCLCDTLASSLNENKKNEGIQLFPNPASDIVNVAMGDIKEAMIIFYNSIGQIVLKATCSNQINVIDIRDLPPDLYLIQMATENKVLTQKIIKL